MAEGGDPKNQRKLRRVRLMSPHPPRPFQPFSGPPVVEGDLIASIPIFTLLSSQSLRHYHSISQKHLLIPRVDCAFDPYSEEWITASIDIQVLHLGGRLLPLPDGPFIFMGRYSVSDRKRIYIPYRRSKQSTSTAFSSDGNRIAWRGYTRFNVYDRLENKRRDLRNTSKTVCGAFSPDGKYLALLTVSEDLLYLKVINAKTFSFVVGGFSFPETIPATQPPHTYFEDKSVHLLWSKCGTYLGMSTYYGELMVSKVGHMINSRKSRRSLFPILRHNKDFEKISHPQAYDFGSIMYGKKQDQNVTILALGIVQNLIRLYDIVDSGLGHLIAQTDVRDNEAACSDLTINCLRFSNAQDLLAVALSNGVINLLDSVSLHKVKVLQPVNFAMQHQPKTMPFYHGFSSLHFACSDKFLAAGATDMFVRVWCVQRSVERLVSLCRSVIRSYCNFDDMSKLPLSSALLIYLADVSF